MNETPMNDELRSAAERLRSGFEYEHCPDYWRDCDDARLLAAAYLSLVPADSELAIDEPWLRSVGAVKEDHPSKWNFRREDALDVGLWLVDDGWKAMLLYGEHAASCIRRGLNSRGDVRRLAAALGIQLATP